MAPNHTQQPNQAPEIRQQSPSAAESMDSNPSANSGQLGPEQLRITMRDHRIDNITGGRASSSKNDMDTNKDNVSQFSSVNRLLDDMQLIRNRSIYSNSLARRRLELMCEDKVSKHKLEEVHFSMPSSVKSTFIMTFSPDGQRVASTHGDHRIYICDLNTGKLLDTLEGHPKTPWCLAWHPSCKEILASGCLAGEVRVWDLRSKVSEKWISENNTIITSLDFHPKERVLVIATANDIHFWDWSESEPFAKTTTTHDKEKVKFVEFDSSGTKLVTGISNLPKYVNYSSDSLQNRIIDSYLTQGTLEPLPAVNMTQNSETTTTLNEPLSSNVNFVERNSNSHQSSTSNSQSISSTDNTGQDLSYRSTLTLSRVAILYQQLEALEDSMRHTTFSPYISPRPINTSVETINQNSSSIRGENQSSNNPPSEVIDDDQSDTNEIPPTHQRPSHGGSDQTSIDSQSSGSIRTPHSFEPSLVSFDDSLEHLQLQPLLIDGHPVNLANTMEDYPIEATNHLNYVMQFESINQVNQNFIRISKLMSSVRLYRQIVQQIRSSQSGRGHFLPNQILTAQSASPRSSRNAPNLPIVFRNFPANSMEASGGMRPTDPILAIQFRNSARNVPLVTICKIDLLSARAICITRSQQLIEQSLVTRHPSTDLRPVSNVAAPLADSIGESSTSELSSDNSASSNLQISNNLDSMPKFYHLLYQLYESLNLINHAPLTTSNVHTYITSLRSILDKLLATLSSMCLTPSEGCRIVDLIHGIAFSLTGRSWRIPLGATMDDIRLDVIQTLCIVDLTLHLARQVQLLQMHRLSAMARIEESRNSGRHSHRIREQQQPTNTNDRASCNVVAPIDSNITDSVEASTSQSGSSIAESGSKKRNLPANLDEPPKKRRSNHEDFKTTVEPELLNSRGPSNTKITDTNNLNRNIPPQNPTSGQDHSMTDNQINSVLPNSRSSDPSMPSDRMVTVWNSTQTQTFEQTLQRLLVATASSMTNSHILVRIYHRLHGQGPSISASNNNILDNPSVLERPNPSPPHESRRRALSQDHSLASSFPAQENASNRTIDTDRGIGAQAFYGLPHLFERPPQLHVYQARGGGQHLWFNQWTIPIPVGNSNYRLQCWNFSLSAIPNIKDSQSNVVTPKCRIHNDSSIDISSDGSLLACLVPRNDGACLSSFDLKVFSLQSSDFGCCYHQLSHGPNAISVSLSPSGKYAVVGLASNKFVSTSSIVDEDDLVIAKVFKLDGKLGHVRDIKIKRDESSLSLNAIRWMERGIVYNVGPQHHQRYQATRMRNRVP